jgi:ABC-2 type transport system permease protein
VRRLRGEDQIRRYLQFALDRYLESRAGSAGEPPLVRVSGQSWLAYQKGALALYLLQERLGEDAVNRALRRLLQRYRFKGAPYARSIDLVDALRAEAHTTEEQNLITDLLERVVLYDLKTTAPTVIRRADGMWEVTVPIEAKKYTVDARGVEAEAALAERIEVGLFTEEPGRDGFDAKSVIVMERRPIRSGAQVLRFVTNRRPTYAGIDPYNYYIDRHSGDNVQRIADPE